MKLSETAQATMLLTCYFSKAGSEDIKPLTVAEWKRFALWLEEKGTNPGELLETDPKQLLAGWHDNGVGRDRILALLRRGHSLAFAMEKWSRAGLWVVTRADSEYPKQLLKKLRRDSPPVFIGCGDRSLLSKRGMAVVGSRKAPEEDLRFAEQLGAKAASEEVAIVSGGALGVDEAAMLGAVHAKGHAIGVLKDRLLEAVTSAKWRKAIMDNHLVLLSPFSPEARFSKANAMARNKYIYCLAETSVVVRAGRTGGTVNGAKENLMKGWVPLYVKPTRDQDTANEYLVNKGGKWCPENIHDIKLSDFFDTEAAFHLPSVHRQPDMFSKQSDSDDMNSADCLETDRQIPAGVQEERQAVYEAPVDPGKDRQAPISFYQLFVEALANLATEPIGVDELAAKTELHKSQVSDWLNRALEEKQVKKLTRPIRYQCIKSGG